MPRGVYKRTRRITRNTRRQVEPETTAERLPEAKPIKSADEGFGPVHKIEIEIAAPEIRMSDSDLYRFSLTVDSHTYSQGTGTYPAVMKWIQNAIEGVRLKLFRFGFTQRGQNQ